MTGIGAVTPIGNSATEYAESLKNGVLGLSDITRFDTSGLSKRAFQVTGFEPPPFAKIHDPFIQYVFRAVEEALRDSGLDLSQLDRDRVGIAVSSSKGGMMTFERFYGSFLKHTSALLAARVYANFPPNLAAQWIARHWELFGPAKTVSAACATGLYSVMEGIRMIEQDEADFCIAGAGDASVTRLMLAGYRQMGVLSMGHMRPFDARRDGFLIGEGAGIVILESEESAHARGASVYGRVLSYAYGFESFHPYALSAESDGLTRCLKQVLRTAGINASDIEYLNVHGTATRQGDLYETRQIKSAFGKAAYHIPMSSTKSLVGHMIGASGVVELIACLVAMRDSFIPPTANLEQVDPECDLDYTPLRSKEQEVKIACSISMGFGGQLGAILFA